MSEKLKEVVSLLEKMNDEKIEKIIYYIRVVDKNSSKKDFKRFGLYKDVKMLADGYDFDEENGNIIKDMVL